MKQLLVISLFSFCMLPLNSHWVYAEKSKTAYPQKNVSETITNSNSICFQSESGQEKMLAIVFKKQDYCRLELKDFEFEPIFNLVSATVYFSGTNFKNTEKGTITSTSLKPIRSLMERCAPGTFVIFDNVKIIGPDKMVRSIPGTSLLLH